MKLRYDYIITYYTFFSEEILAPQEGNVFEDVMRMHQLDLARQLVQDSLHLSMPQQHGNGQLLGSEDSGNILQEVIWPD